MALSIQQQLCFGQFSVQTVLGNYMKLLTPYNSPLIYGVGLPSLSPRPEVETQFFSVQRWAASESQDDSVKHEAPESHNNVG